jgi:hypothetical protein
MQCVGIGSRVNAGDCDTKLSAGPGDPASDLAAIGDQNFVKHGGLSSSHPEHAEMGILRW